MITRTREEIIEQFNALEADVENLRPSTIMAMARMLGALDREDIAPGRCAIFGDDRDFNGKGCDYYLARVS